jgi:XTP/dITP diphosphohydrolase
MGMPLYVATKNAGKLRELQALFAGVGWEAHTYAAYVEPVEGESSYAHNAALKAEALAAQLRAAGIRAAVLGDDSGLEVTALGGRPGVLSARYGGAEVSWIERRALLLREMLVSGSVDRRARFICALHWIDPQGKACAVLEALDGEIARADRGESGFSYDPIFLYPKLGRTFGELREEEKNVLSHRALAVKALLRRFPSGLSPAAQAGSLGGAEGAG